MVRLVILGLLLTSCAIASKDVPNLGQEVDAFWCSEWIAFVLKNIGMKLPYLENEHRLDPSHSLQWPQKNITSFISKQLYNYSIKENRDD